MTEERTGYTTRDVTTLSNAQLIEEALQSGYTSGFYAAAQGAASLLHIEARNRRNATFAEIKRRLAQAERLAEALCALIDHRDGEYYDNILSSRDLVLLERIKRALTAPGRARRNDVAEERAPHGGPPPIIEHSDPALDELIWAAHDTGYYAGRRRNGDQLLHAARLEQRDIAWQAMSQRLAQAERLAEVAQIITHATMYNGVYEVSAADMGNLHKALAAWQGKEE